MAQHEQLPLFKVPPRRYALSGVQLLSFNYCWGDTDEGLVGEGNVARGLNDSPMIVCLVYEDVSELYEQQWLTRETPAPRQDEDEESKQEK